MKLSTRSLFFVLLCTCFIFAHLASASGNKTQIQLDPRFDSGSARLARMWQNLKGDLPHEKIPGNADEIKKPGDWGKDYAVGIVKIVGPGLAIALLSILAGVVYGIFKLIRLCCCRCKSDDEDSESEEVSFTWSQKWVPTILYCVFFVFLLTGMIIGLINNPRFSDGVNDMGDSVISVGAGAVDLGDGLVASVDTIVDLIPASITNIDYEFSGVEPLAEEVTELSDDVDSASSQVNNITYKVSQINVGNSSGNPLANLQQELNSINNASAGIIAAVSDLTSQIADKLRTTYNETIGGLADKVDEITPTVDELKDTANSVISEAQDLVNDVTKYVDDAKSYDSSRGKAVMALFVLVIVTIAVIVLGYVFRKKPIFNTISALGFVFLFLLWLSGSIHFLMGMALYDACPVIDVAVKGLLPTDSTAADVLEGCLYEHRSVLDSLNITAYNLSSVFDYRSEFEEVSDFGSSFNFTYINDYFARIQNLRAYNLTAVADNITVASFGWNESYVYDVLDGLNQLTAPDQFTLDNYETTCDPNNYPNPSQVSDQKQRVTDAVNTNTTIYNKTAVAKQELYDTQNDINILLANMTTYQERLDDINAQVETLSTDNITACIAILDNLQANITAFFELGNCSFLGDAYVDIRTSLCETMQPSIDLLTIAQFLAGLALIPLVIIAEILSFRIPKCKSLNPMDFDDDYAEEEDEEKGYSKKKEKNIAMETQKPIKEGSVRNTAISATISAEPPGTNSANSSPDFSVSVRRKSNSVHPSTTAPLLPQQNLVLPPIIKKNNSGLK